MFLTFISYFYLLDESFYLLEASGEGGISVIHKMIKGILPQFRAQVLHPMLYYIKIKNGESRDLRDRTMEDKFMYIPDNNKQNYSLMDLNNNMLKTQGRFISHFQPIGFSKPLKSEDEKIKSFLIKNRLRNEKKNNTSTHVSFPSVLKNESNKGLEK